MGMFRHLALLGEQNRALAPRPTQNGGDLLDPARGIIRGVLAGLLAWSTFLLACFA